MVARRRFGRIRRLPSGRYQVRYHGPDGMDRPAPQTFATKKEAEIWLVSTEAEIRVDHWVLNPDEGSVAFADFAAVWVDERTNLRPSTVQVYRYILRKHLTPGLGRRTVADIREAHVRRWRKELLDSGLAIFDGEGVPAAQGHHEHCCG